MPLTTFHSVIDSPLSVRRVTPPTTTIITTIAATISSQRAMESGRARLGGAGRNRFDTEAELAMMAAM